MHFDKYFRSQSDLFLIVQIGPSRETHQFTLLHSGLNCAKAVKKSILILLFYKQQFRSKFDVFLMVRFMT